MSHLAHGAHQMDCRGYATAFCQDRAAVPPGPPLLRVVRLLALGLFAAGVAPSLGAQSPIPVLLVHGIWSDCHTWDDVATDLRASGFTEGPDLLFPYNSVTARYGERCWSNPNAATLAASAGVAAGPLRLESAGYADAIRPLSTASKVFASLTFESNAGQDFETQGKQVAVAVQRLREWTGAPKVVIAAHSMGGLAARAYLQSAAYRGDVATLITVDTPHGGSPLADMPRDAMAPACRDAARFLKGMSMDDPAVRYLLPDSRELGQLNTGIGPFGSMPGDIRIHGFLAAYTSTGTRSGCLTEGRRNQLTNEWTNRLSGELTLRADKAGNGFQFSADLVRKFSDGVVPFVAQHPLFAAAISRSQVTVEAIEGYHTDVLHDAAPRARIVAKIMEEAGTGAPVLADTKFEDRTLKWQGEVEVRDSHVRFELWDSAKIDGDRVTLVINGVRVLSNRELSATRHSIEADLHDGENVVYLIAENEGSESPNTAALAVSDRTGVSRTLVLRANLQTTAAYRVVVRR